MNKIMNIFKKDSKLFKDNVYRIPLLIGRIFIIDTKIYRIPEWYFLSKIIEIGSIAGREGRIFYLDIFHKRILKIEYKSRYYEYEY